MTKLFFAAVLLATCCVSCSHFTGLRKRSFTFENGDQQQTLRLRVPKRYASRQRFVDSAGNQQQVYKYKNGALLYFIHTTDTLSQFHAIDTTNNIPLPHPYGGLLYKGVDTAYTFWREIRTDSFRFGYRFVPGAAENLFDSAVNYAGMRRFKK